MCDYFSSILVSVLCNWGHLQILWWFSYYSFSHSMGLNLLMCYSWLCIMSCSFDCCICLSLHLYYKKVCTMPLCNTERCPVMLLRLQPNMYFLCDFMFVLVSDCRSWSSKHNWELQVVPHGMFIYKAVIFAVRCWNFFLWFQWWSVVLQRAIASDIKESVCRVPDTAFDGNTIVLTVIFM